MAFQGKLESGPINSEKDLLKLDIIDWNRLINYWDNTQEAATAICSWLIGSGSHYTIFKYDLTKAPDRDDWPGWKHVGNHEPMGKLFWNWFHYHRRGDIYFSDSPDFNGKLRLRNSPEVTFYGDIGKVSAPTFIRTIKLLDAHDVWISVVDEDTQVMIEPLGSIRQLWGDFLSGALGTRPEVMPDIQQLKLF